MKKVERERRRPVISQVDVGNRTPILGLTQYFAGIVILTCKLQHRPFQSKSKLQLFLNNTQFIEQTRVIIAAKKRIKGQVY